MSQIWVIFKITNTEDEKKPNKPPPTPARSWALSHYPVEGGCGWKAAEKKTWDIGTNVDCRKFTVGRKKKTLPQLRQNITEASVAGWFIMCQTHLLAQWWKFHHLEHWRFCTALGNTLQGIIHLWLQQQEESPDRFSLHLVSMIQGFGITNKWGRKCCTDHIWLSFPSADGTSATEGANWKPHYPAGYLCPSLCAFHRSLFMNSLKTWGIYLPVISSQSRWPDRHNAYPTVTRACACCDFLAHPQAASCWVHDWLLKSTQASPHLKYPGKSFPGFCPLS